jgi:ABC-type Fe3+ transport system permease subunit
MRESIWGVLTFFLVVAVLFVLAPGQTINVSASSTNATQTVDQVGSPVVNSLLGVGTMAVVALFIGAFLAGENW